MSGVELAPVSLVTNARNNRLWVDPDDSRGRELVRTFGNVNPHSLAMWNLALGLHAWDLVADVGCNFGEMLVGADLPAAADIVAFEPDVAVLPYLERTLENFKRPVDLVRCAVSDHVGTERFIHDDVWSGNSGLAEYAAGVGSAQSSVDVLVTTLDESIGARRPGSVCIKIDVEGAEAAVLRGAANLLGSVKYWAIMIEILHMPREELSQLAARYPLYLLDKRQNRFVRVHTESVASLDYLLTAGWLYAQDALLVSSPDLVILW